MAKITFDGQTQISPDGTILIDTVMPGGWTARYRFIRQAGTYCLAEVHVEPSGKRVPPGGLTSRLLKRLTPFEALDTAEAQLRKAEKQSSDPSLPNFDRIQEYFSEVRLRTGDFKTARNRPGRPARPDLFYARAAERYIDLIPSGSPMPFLARELGLKPSGAEGVIREARRRSLLSGPASRGKAGGELTAKAKRLLQKERQRDD